MSSSSKVRSPSSQEGFGVVDFDLDRDYFWVRRRATLPGNLISLFAGDLGFIATLPRRGPVVVGQISHIGVTSVLVASCLVVLAL